ncbi:MAG: HD-GYP domain-containing protein, partial [Gemmatimonadetes bacterium]|nr:HD-GYP domain-containing protein [Gemmatimonadota bacterium]
PKETARGDAELPRGHPTDFPLRLIKRAGPATTPPFPATQWGGGLGLGWGGSELFIATFKTLAQALEAKDPYTAGHSFRVSAYARALSRELGLSEGEVTQIGLAAELHDIGKIGVPERLLNKRTALLPSEYARIMEHTVEGERILKPLFQGHPIILGIVRWHHERMDGRGLPDGIRGEEIPLPARIVSVADAFDAMTSTRWYRPARSARFALDELEQKAGTQFDAQCASAFASTFPTGLCDTRPSKEVRAIVYGRRGALGVASGW